MEPCSRGPGVAHVVRPDESQRRLQAVDDQEAQDLKLLFRAHVVGPERDVGSDAEAHTQIEDEDDADAGNRMIEPGAAEAAAPKCATAKDSVPVDRVT